MILEDNAIKLSVVLNHAGAFESIRKTIRHVGEQTALSEMELILVSTEVNARTIDRATLVSIPRWRSVIVSELPYGAAGWAAGIREAVGAAVVLVEDHSYPSPNWAATLIEGHKMGYAVVVPEMKNGNPTTLVSWANFHLTFIEWFRPKGCGEVPRGPGHNSSYDKSALLEMGGDLTRWLLSEAVLHEKMVSKGLRIFLDARCFTRHVNLSKPQALLSHSFHGGRLFGSSRAMNWGLLKRVVYALSFPLVPVVRLKRLFGFLHEPDRRKEAKLFRALPWTAAALMCHAFGEAVGYLRGSGNSISVYQAFETRRLDFVVESDRNLILESELDQHSSFEH